MPHRYFTQDIGGGRAVLSGPDAHHLARVMRARVGDTVILCDGNAVEYTGTVTALGPDTVEFAVTEGYPTAAEPGVELTLFAGYPKQGKLEDHPARHRAGRDPFCAVFQPVLRGRAQKGAPEKRAVQPHRAGGSQAGGPGRGAGCGAAAGKLRRGVPRLCRL